MQATELIEQSTLSVISAGVPLFPKHYTHLHGEPGRHYLLVAYCECNVYDAVVYAKNGDAWLCEDQRIDRFSATHVEFTMNSDGQIQVWNWSDTAHSPNPTVRITLYPI